MEEGEESCVVFEALLLGFQRSREGSRSMRFTRLDSVLEENKSHLIVINNFLREDGG